VYHAMSGWGWFWMTLMPILWIAMLGAVVYLAVRLGNRHEGHDGHA
jgi:hypothetical protein